MRRVRLAVTIVAIREADKFDDVSDPENLDISSIKLICDEVTLPHDPGASLWAQFTYEMVVEAKTDDEAIHTTQENLCWYCAGWELDSLVVRLIESENL